MRTVKRLVVLIDGAEQREVNKNQSSIQRLNKLVREGACSSGGSVVQIPKYYVASATATKLSDRFKTKGVADETADLIKTIVKDVCYTLEHAEDELWLYGSGHGAFVARAVAGVVHRLGLPRRELADYDELFDATCALMKAELEDDHRHWPQLKQTIQSQADPGPRIRFVGLFDTVKLTSPKTHFDISLVPSIETLRHALAMNESRSSRTAEVIEVTDKFDRAKKSLVQAWFLGTTDDMCGGTESDGLSFYPLQWIVLESIFAGLILTTSGKPVTVEHPMTLVFPQYAGRQPDLDGSEEIEWRLRFTNGINVSMFDLQSTHAANPSNRGNIHSIKLSSDRYARGSSRKIFGPEGLNGWHGIDPNGTIIHPSVFCVLDRTPRLLEIPGMKPLKRQISNFQEKCFVENEDALAPWLKDVQLEESTVKAFRILVCGKTGVGKSTLINKVFGVEMTEESLSYDQGVHDINVAFESPKHPGLLIHDSRGWQAGSDTELELIAKFLRYRAFQQDPGESLHVIWFCVDADVSRIEEADKRTFATIAQFSNQVPVFVVGTKKDKLTGYRKMQFLEELMEKTDDYKEAKRLAEEKANRVAEEQFAELRNQLSQIDHYKADGFCCLSKNDDVGIRDLLNQTLGLIVDERKISSAITECMRLGTHAIRTAAVPLPFSGMIGTPTVSRLICEHVLQCFGFPKTTPDEIERIMNDIVMGNLKKFLKVSLTQFAIIGAITIGSAIPTAGIGVVAGAVGCLWGQPPTARMLLKCSCDMILILERSFRYGGKYVSVKEIEDAARYYTTSTIKTFSGKERRLQERVHEEIDELIPLRKVTIGFKFNKLRGSIEDIIYGNRFGVSETYDSVKSSSSLALGTSDKLAELSAPPPIAELPGDMYSPSFARELDGEKPIAELGSEKPAVELDSFELPNSASTTGTTSVLTTLSGTTAVRSPSSGKAVEMEVPMPELEGNTLVGGPRVELEASAPSRWGRLSSWKIGSKKSKTK